MYATAEFEFDQSENGWLMSEFSFVRSLFLILLFPPAINIGRRLWSGATAAEAADAAPPRREDSDGSSTAHDDDLPTSPREFDVSSLPGDPEPIKPPPPSNSDTGNVYTFDLVFLRWSLVVDGALTTIAAFATKPWHIYLGG